LVVGGVSKCGDKKIPSYFTRLNHPEIASFIAAPDINAQDINAQEINTIQSSKRKGNIIKYTMVQ
jgi:hypothetical protein